MGTPPTHNGSFYSSNFLFVSDKWEGDTGFLQSIKEFEDCISSMPRTRQGNMVPLLSNFKDDNRKVLVPKSRLEDIAAATMFNSWLPLITGEPAKGVSLGRGWSGSREQIAKDMPPRLWYRMVRLLPGEEKRSGWANRSYFQLSALLFVVYLPPGSTIRGESVTAFSRHTFIALRYLSVFIFPQPQGLENNIYARK